MFESFAINQHLPNIPHASILIANISGLLINSNPALDQPRSLPPTFIDVGGIHIKRGKSLSKVSNILWDHVAIYYNNF